MQQCARPMSGGYWVGGGCCWLKLYNNVDWAGTSPVGKCILSAFILSRGCAWSNATCMPATFAICPKAVITSYMIDWLPGTGGSNPDAVFLQRHRVELLNTAAFCSNFCNLLYPIFQGTQPVVTWSCATYSTVCL